MRHSFDAVGEEPYTKSRTPCLGQSATHARRSVGCYMPCGRWSQACASHFHHCGLGPWPEHGLIIMGNFHKARIDSQELIKREKEGALHADLSIKKRFSMPVSVPISFRKWPWLHSRKNLGHSEGYLRGFLSSSLLLAACRRFGFKHPELRTKKSLPTHLDNEQRSLHYKAVVGNTDLSSLFHINE